MRREGAARPVGGIVEISASRRVREEKMRAAAPRLITSAIRHIRCVSGIQHRPLGSVAARLNTPNNRQTFDAELVCYSARCEFDG